jgi:hypothetical protein
VTVLLLQGHRIQQIQKTATADHTWQEKKFKGEIAWYDECKANLDRWQIVAMTKGECSEPRCIATAKKVVCREVSNK